MAYSTTSRKVEISALRRALAVERKAHCPDFQGRQSTFSQFMRRTADRLCRQFPLDARWSTIRGLFFQYPNLDIATRISVLRRVEELLDLGEPSVQPLSLAGAVAESKAHLEAKPSARTNNKTKTERNLLRKDEGQAAKNQVLKKPADNDRHLTASPDQVDVQFVRGVGPKISALLNKLDIYTAEDLIRHYPRRHLDFQNHLKISELKAGQEVTILGTIRSTGAFQARNGAVSIVSIVIADNTGSITVNRFVGGKANKYLLDRIKGQYPKGAHVLASGLVEPDRFSKRYQLKNAEVEVLDGNVAEDEDLQTIHAGRLVPVYPLTEGLGLRHLRSIIFNALEAYQDRLVDPLPQAIIDQYHLLLLPEAVRTIHFPQDLESKEEARRRLVFDELFFIQLSLIYRRYKEDRENTACLLSAKPGGFSEKLRALLPFRLTGAQERVLREITRDMASAKPMHRLVQGDVGSGKTVVALMALLVAIENGYQGALMAPTEILAEQHFRQFQNWLSRLGLCCALLVGNQGKAERRQVLQDLASGQIHIAVGTHALIQDGVEFANLGLIIIDEQHRFGVKQRAQLKAKGQNPQLLTMTATPIPRTLALSLHGDLDISEIDELPPGRKPIETKVLNSGQKRQLWGFLSEQINKGRQAYIVFPLIEESETLSAKAATAEYENLKTSVFPDLRVGLMHGKLKPQEKDEVMEKFRKHEYDILVSTTVIEVGVDVPNATVMVIENADRFGLAQLHQLRGRVGRGEQKSYCFLVTESRSQTTAQKLGVLAQTNDGFVVAEKDLELRGPGEFLGTRQSGLPDLCLTDLIADARILEEARKAALAVIKDDPDLAKHALLLKHMTKNNKSAAADYLGAG